MTVFIRFKYVSISTSRDIINTIKAMLDSGSEIDSSSDTHITIHVYSDNLELDFSIVNPNLFITAMEVTKHS